LILQGFYHFNAQFRITSHNLYYVASHIISEYPPGTKPDANHFPMRNRLISAWCKKLLVVEAGEKSGSLLTAAYAKEQNREVFAAPNSIYIRESIGTNKLIVEGAKMYLNSSQLLLDNVRKPRVNRKIENAAPIGDDLTAPSGDDLTALEKAILAKIEDSPMNLGEVLVSLKEDKSDILETISIMELKGMINNVGGIFKKCR